MPLLRCNLPRLASACIIGAHRPNGISLAGLDTRSFNDPGQCAGDELINARHQIAGDVRLGMRISLDVKPTVAC